MTSGQFLSSMSSAGFAGDVDSVAFYQLLCVGKRVLLLSETKFWLFRNPSAKLAAGSTQKRERTCQASSARPPRRCRRYPAFSPQAGGFSAPFLLGWDVRVLRALCAQRSGVSVPSVFPLRAGGFGRAVPGEPASVGVLHDGRCGELLLTRFLRQEGGLLRMEGEPAPWKPSQLEEPERLCQAYGLLQPEVAEFCPDSLRERLFVLPQLPAAELLHAPESLFPWPQDLPAQERSVEPLYVRQAVFVKPAALRAPL